MGDESRPYCGSVALDLWPRSMLYETPHIRVEADDGIATLWLEFPGAPVNALSPGRLAEFERAIGAVANSPHIEILVIRSGKPAGFCGGYEPDTLDFARDEDAALFSQAGQRALNRLAAVPQVTVAFLEGPCLGPGLELALACDYRLAVTGPDAWLGFPNTPCWGGTVRAPRLRVGELHTAREAQRAGLVEDAFCVRRAKIELRTFLDQQQMRPRKRPARNLDAKLAAERKAFREAWRAGAVPVQNVSCPLPQGGRSQEPLPELVGFVGHDALAVEIALRGGRAALSARNDGAVSRAFGEAVGRGRATPLEAEQARKRIIVAPGFEHLAEARWVIADTVPDWCLSPRTIVCVPSADLRAARIHAGHSPESIATAAEWLGRIGLRVTVNEMPARGFAARLTAA